MDEVIRGADGQTDYATLHSVQSALRGLTEEEKRLIAVSTISVVSQLAVQFENDEVCLISCLRYHDPIMSFPR